ncbi:GSU2403 family nucleotidyltransferase fold protein [Ferrigenium sp. UT5]|uniref:GSU2403 family nucleotidyltransferase fold protein n=1 Tax=Ferrigenium sp. UT5 TaxID=3242105 RepID=UPI00354FA784
MRLYAELSSSAQNAYADLFDAVLASSVSNSVANLNGSFGTKSVHQKKYWYFQYRDINGSVRQIYIGPDSDKVRALIAQHQSHEMLPIRKLAAAAVALGCNPVLPKHYRVIKRLDEYGFFKRGGILVGTHAFLTMCNMLGISPAERMQTQDVDFAHAGKNISIALPANIKVETRSALESLEMGLIPVSTFKGTEGARYVNPSDPAFMVDFLTAKTSVSDEPVHIEGLSIALQPLKFMEFSMKDTTQAGALGNDGAVLVTVPKPDRFAIHKLIVSAERKISETAKINKDVRQANVLIQYYMDSRPDELAETCKEAKENGPGWEKRLRKGISKLKKINPAASGFLLETMGD